ncbi:MAG: RDD family protein [Chloroflexi bacterium]|nr:RDD family protein [Chloroflexota bacterium]MDA1145575.1 RDD family protein [Chloroflexota bacterium]
MTAGPDPAEADPTETPSELGHPGLSWSGDGSLAAGHVRQRTPLDVEFEVYPPALEEGQDGFALATFNRRAVGFAIDRLLIAACAIAVSWLAGVPESTEAASAQFYLITTLIETGYGLNFNPRGWSPGKLAMGLRIVKEAGEAPGLRWGVMRTAASVLSQVLLLGYIWAYFDRRTQTWHDKLAKTYVVRVTDEGPKSSGGWRR